ncbi:MAG TPA: MBL fold metallo-hydrolase [Acidimicrobiales bacterium]|nr:MBL fold metallo-hydrolase [Acidimicrobiales bacterium]
MSVLRYKNDQAEVHSVIVGPLDTNVYVLRCRNTGKAVLLDAADDAPKLVDMARSLGVDRVLETHGHGDHIAAVPGVREAGLPVGISPADAHYLDGHDFDLVDDEIIEVGDLRLRTVFTPGHTMGSTSFVLEGDPLWLFAGDTLFPGGPGTARHGGDFPTIIESIRERLFTLPDDTVVMPGHGKDTTIGTERPHLQEWIDRGW